MQLFLSLFPRLRLTYSMSESEHPGVGDEPPPYMIFVVVFLFFLIGLLGFLVCNLLKKKGYRCRAGDMDFEEEENDKLGENAGGWENNWLSEGVFSFFFKSNRNKKKLWN